ncbi:peptidylprolyl isomerase [Candidatus Nitronereus thalassa]|uniref:Peptidyl-prolyl cis-trans isomerase n=1 Tax=Candidatus Nitronereus thalassa TaxID=3020898 RepID=A0ABU3KBS2_9BACT|nr:peptidylprolyl isomerase [Candidatus Nitronereus thalassa]MDT7043757.1 peptidylprolyl isomerase [Candidatus Nitronereus thalassa]
MDHPQPGDKVKIHYTCTLNDGSVCDSTHRAGPLELKLGQGEILREIEQRLLRMEFGESARVTLTPDLAYGQYRHELVTEIDQKEFRDRGIQPKIGLTLDINPPAGESMVARITEVDDTKVRLDANHPLAGQTLQYDLQLVSKVL